MEIDERTEGQAMEEVRREGNERRTGKETEKRRRKGDDRKRRREREDEMSERGVKERRGRGVEEMREKGKEEKREKGKEERRKRGKEEKRKKGKEERSETGTEEKSERGKEEKRKRGVKERSETGAEEKRETGKEERRKRGKEERSETGTEERRKRGKEERREKGKEERRKKGVKERSERGLEEGQQQRQQGMYGREENPSKGLSVSLAAFFLVTRVTGAGFVVLPKALAHTGWIGVSIMVMFCLVVSYSGTRLASCWLILEERWPHHYSHGSRQPYVDIADTAFGKYGRCVAIFVMIVGSFGPNTVYLVLTASLLNSLVAELSTCVWILVTAVVFIPFTWLGTPKDYWQVSVISVLVSTGVCVIILCELLKGSTNTTTNNNNNNTNNNNTNNNNNNTLHHKHTPHTPPQTHTNNNNNNTLHHKHTPHTPPQTHTNNNNNNTLHHKHTPHTPPQTHTNNNTNNTLHHKHTLLPPLPLPLPHHGHLTATPYTFVLGFSTLLFSYGGTRGFPNIQIDMEDRTQFWKSIVLGNVVILALYLPIAVTGYAILGHHVPSDILFSLDPHSVTTKAVILLQILNLIATYITGFNPTAQGCEDLLMVQRSFGWGRVLVRSGLVALQALVGLAVPLFDRLMTLFGASVVPLASLILPPLMYMKLINMNQQSQWPQR
ncbi:hypothetical protein Pmani_039886 [Petrolisthes manimaculis]|uniref:Amino acid transporter transmembrane domain-containing protein n=1 Tax=Petrolisthes manimaculis TaxID=1843537 RepID=A0AAE1TKW5_9EUCA|nr:hypothetical protein Pmani_039886 [Petrolisthes manimaculis]